MKRFGRPEDIANAVEFLITNSYMTNKVSVQLCFYIRDSDLWLDTCCGWRNDSISVLKPVEEQNTRAVA